MQRTKTICTYIKEGYIRIIPAMFGVNPAVVKEEMSFEAIIDAGGPRRTWDTGHTTIIIARHEPKAQVS